MSGYHITPIPRGVYGQASKIEEEFLEFKDALLQSNKLMSLIELSDLIGAVEAYAENNGSSLSDLLIMLEATKRAFNDGTRSNRDA